MTGQKGRSGGRNRLPTSIKETKGTIRNHRTNRKEPTPTPGIPLPPEWLDEEGVAQYHRLSPHVKAMGVCSLHDGDALAIAATALTEYLDAKRKVKREGITIKRETKNGETTIANPAVSVRDSAWRRYQSSLRSFGLDPQSRGTVSALTQPDAGNEFFN